MRQFRFVFVVLALACLLAGGCTENMSGGQGGNSHGVVASPQVDETHPNIMVVYGNQELNGNVAVVRKIYDDSSKLAKCSLTIQNLSDHTFILEYQFRWLEASGMPIMQTPAWSRLTLAPHAVKPVLTVAKMPEAKIVEFTLRLPMTALYERPAEQYTEPPATGYDGQYAEPYEEQPADQPDDQPATY